MKQQRSTASELAKLPAALRDIVLHVEYAARFLRRSAAYWSSEAKIDNINAALLKLRALEPLLTEVDCNSEDNDVGSIKAAACLVKGLAQSVCGSKK